MKVKKRMYNSEKLDHYVVNCTVNDFIDQVKTTVLSKQKKSHNLCFKIIHRYASLQYSMLISYSVYIINYNLSGMYL